MSARQLTFDLGHRAALARDDFFVAPCNAVAVAWVDRWPDWPNQGLALWGPASCGKSHLAAVWRHRSDGVPATLADLLAVDPPTLLGTANHVLIENIDATLPDAAAERQLLHLYNVVAERRGTLLLTARQPPARWPVDLADLGSRLNALAAVTVEQPDDDLLAAVLVKLFADRQLSVDPGVIEYALPRIERSFAGARTLVETLDSAALATHRRIAPALIREVLATNPAP